MNLRKRLIVFGGGPLPEAGLNKFMEWAEDAEQPRILLVAWASEEVEETIIYYREVFSDFESRFDVSRSPPLTAAERKKFLVQLSDATAVFFTGGDQNRIAAAYAHSDIRNALHEAYRGGIPFAGTSAGTAIMSAMMFSGDSDPGALDTESVLLSEGLGLVEGVMFDQHFLKRQRQNRLFAAIFRHPELIGIGIDEGTGLEIQDGRIGTVRGPEKVMRVAKTNGKRALDVELFHEGESFELLSSRSTLFSQAAS